MRLFNIFKRGQPEPKIKKRSYFEAAKTGRLTNAWTIINKSADAAISPDLLTMRARSRELGVNNDYGKRFLHLVKQNVVGHQGIVLQVRARYISGKPDEMGSRAVETAWREWGRKGVCTADGQLSWIDVQKLTSETVPKDGEILIRMIDGWEQNKFGFALQLIEADYIDEKLNKNLPNGNKIRMGVEKNVWNRPVAYWLLRQHPYDNPFVERYTGSKHQRIPAEQFLHIYLMERINQTRGVPWMATPAYRLHMLGGFEEAELVASRVSSSKMGFFKTPSGNEYVGDDEDDAEAPISEAEPGTFEQLPKGWEFQAWDPDHPNNAFEAFVQAVLRGVASGLNVSYVSLANDLRGVSYSSIRQGVLEDRDAWRVLQTFMIEHLHSLVYEQWLKSAMFNGAVITPKKGAPYGFENYLRFLDGAKWQTRGWEWVDPLKEVNAAVMERQHSLNSSQRIMGSRGRDFFEVVEELEAENKLVKFPGKTEGQGNGKQEDGED